MQTGIFHIQALSAVHVGIGQAMGVVDLPIMRSKATHLPLIPGSAIKGVLRDELVEVKIQKDIWFGPENISSSDDSYAGALVIGDAHLLVLPVRSLIGVCAFVTCPFILKRYAQDKGINIDIPTISSGVIAHSSNSVISNNNRSVLEDIDLTTENNTHATADLWSDEISSAFYPNEKDVNRSDFKSRFAIISDDDFSFLADTATEIRARIKINDERGVVEKGALWYEENLPAESILWGVWALGTSRRPQKEDEEKPNSVFGGKNITIQIGGKASVGRGLVRLVTSEKPGAKDGKK